MVEQQLVILVGGSTGMLGHEVVAHLSQAYPNLQVRALTRNPESDSARALAQLPNVSVVAGDYDDSRSLEAAADGADRAYLACNNVAEQSRLERNFIDACKLKGVDRIAKISMFRYFCREDGPAHGAAHYQIEQHLKNSGVNHVIIHPSYFFQVLLYFTEVIKGAGILPLCLGDMKVNMVDCRDVAQFAAALLACNDEEFASFNGQHVEVAGPESLGGEDWVEALGREGVAARYEKVPPEGFRQGLLAAGLPEDLASNAAAAHAHFYDGRAQVSGHATTPALAALAGTPKSPRRFDAFVREVAPIFRA